MEPQPRRDPGATPSPAEQLDALRRGDPAIRKGALADIHGILQRYAKRFLGAQEGQADLQDESIVQSVIGDVLAESVDRCVDDEHFQALLKRRVKHKILDRKKKHRPGAIPVGDDGYAVDPAAAGPGPGTQVVQREVDETAKRERERFIDLCLAAPLTRREERLLGEYLAGRSWEQIAAAIGTTVGAAKKSMSADVRPKVLAEVLDPLRTEVDGLCWGLIKLHFIKRRSLETCASALGISAETAGHLLSGDIQRAVVAHIGEGGLPLLHRLLGYKRD